jgi:CMP-N,N'-diacetyllegionaminic acid synthase
MKSFVFDIDNTIIFSEVNGNGFYIMRGANVELLQKINQLYDQGHQIILHTARHWNHLKITQQQLERIQLKYHVLVMGKPVADFYIDDKAVRPDEFINMDFSNG